MQYAVFEVTNSLSGASYVISWPRSLIVDRAGSMNAVLDLLNVNNWYLTKLVGDMPVRTRDAMAVELMFIRNLKALFAGHIHARHARRAAAVRVRGGAEWAVPVHVRDAVVGRVLRG
jgi:hypothetical protein